MTPQSLFCAPYRRPVLTLGAGFLISLFLPACKRPASSPGSAPSVAPAAVTVAKPIARRLTDWDEFTGRLISRERVEVRARVSGYLNKVSFSEGTEVKEGDLLFTIDPRPYEAAVQRVEAVLAQAKTNAELASTEAKNATALRQGQAISLEEAERRIKSASSEQSAVHAAEAAVRLAKLDLEFTEIRAPISGRISDARVTEGNLVTGGTKDATLLTTIVALDPIYCEIEVDERSALKYRKMHKDGERPSALFVQIPAEMALINQEGWPHHGKIDFVDNQINPETGTIRARAVFPNEDRLMSPGFFAKVRIPGSGEYDGLLIRDSAVGDDQGGSYVWVLDPEDRAVYRPVVLGPLVEGLRVVRQGLKADDRVVVIGLMSVRNGNPLNPTMVDMLPAATPTPHQP
ncbi:MAG: efflux RND transporter periplasmic adaptor subunit [Verrucomicrobiales bacterium]|nr:efflux RND transporter periplasmic adaptor subunit [Verrucomicrobiales bacterium]MCP5558701.1 efflux RND transporter periplasmic adaptor subunit [Verrucomicrobiaceae bacterium]